MRERIIFALVGLAIAGCVGRNTEISKNGMPTADTMSEAQWPRGIYGNVQSSGVTGDLGGFEIRFFEVDNRPMAEFVYCEGWCNKAYTSEVIRDELGFRVQHVELLRSSRNEITKHEVEFLLTAKGGGYALRGWYDGVEFSWGAILSPIDEPFGLEIANSN